MKHSRIILMLAMALTLTVLCAVGALASSTVVSLTASNNNTVYQLYPTPDSNNKLKTQYYSADFSRDVTLTFEDLYLPYGQLALVDISFPDEYKVGENWKTYDWAFPDGFEVYRNSSDSDVDNTFFVRTDALNDESDADFSYSAVNHHAVSYCIDGQKLEKIDYLELEFRVGSDPENMEPVWHGKIGTAEEMDKDLVHIPDHIQNLTLSMVQLRRDDAAEWKATLDADAEDIPDSIQVRVMEGLRIVKEEEFDFAQAQKVVAKRWIEAWKTQNGDEPYVLRAIPAQDHKEEPITIGKPREEERDAVAVDIKTEPEPQEPTPEPQEPTPEPQEPTPEPVEPLSLLLMDGKGGQKLLAKEDADGFLQVVDEASFQLEPGDYTFVIQGGAADEKISCMLTVDGQSKELPIPTGTEKALTLEAGKSYDLSVKRGEDAEAAELVLIGLISKKIEIDSVQIGADGQDGEQIQYINIANVQNEDQLVIRGTAEASVALAWKLCRADGSEVSSGEADCEDNGAWSASIALNENDFAEGYEGQMEFSICYHADAQFFANAGDASKNAPERRAVNVDTKAPTGYIEFVCSDEETIQDVPADKIAVFEKKANREIEIRYGETINGEKVEPGYSWTVDEVDEEEVRFDFGLSISKDPETGVMRITYHLWDEAGNECDMTAAMRIVESIQMEECQIGEDALTGDAWINADQRGKTVTLRGKAEPGERIIASPSMSRSGMNAYDTNAAWEKRIECDDKVAWEFEYKLPENERGEGELRFELQYEDGNLQEAVENLTLCWKFDFEAPKAPEMSVYPDTEEPEVVYLSGDQLQLRVAVCDAESLSMLTLTRDGSDAVDITRETKDSEYHFRAESGKYVFAARTKDPAGNESEEQSLEILVVDKTQVSVDSRYDREILNEVDLKENGMVFAIRMDANRDDAVYECLVDGNPLEAGALTGKNGEAQIIIDYKKLQKCDFKAGEPVCVELHAYYKNLDRERFGSAWDGNIDLWKPAMSIEAIKTRGKNDGKYYFRGERILVKVLVTGNDAVQLTAMGFNSDKDIDAEEQSCTQISGDEYARFDATEKEYDSDRKVPENAVERFYAVDNSDYLRLRISASCVDDAGNAAVITRDLENYNRAQNGKREPRVTGFIAGNGNAAVKVTGQNAILEYYLVIDENISEKKIIPVDKNGSWELKLTADDLPGDFAGSEWKLTARYPNEFYNADAEGNDLSWSFTVPVDVSCVLEWEEPKEGDSSVKVHTEPGAKVYLQLDGDVQMEADAEDNGEVVFDLDRWITKDSKVTVRAVDKHGNENSISKEGAIGVAEHSLISDVRYQQLDRNYIQVSGRGEAGLYVRLRVDASAAQGSAQIKGDGSFMAKLDVGELEKGTVQLQYDDMFEDDEIVELPFEMDRTAPEPSVIAADVSDLGGEVTVKTEAGTTLCFTDGEDGKTVFKTVKADQDVMTVELPKLSGLGGAQLYVYAVDEYDNASEPVELEVKVSPRIKAGFDQPEEEAVLDSKGRVTLTGWIVTADDKAPEDLSLFIEGNAHEPQTLGLGSGADVTLHKDDGRLEADENLRMALSQEMDVQHCWRFEYELTLGEWGKGKISVEVMNEDTVIASRSFTSDVNAKRKMRYIALCALTLVAFVVCLTLIASLNKRIRRISDGKIDPNSGMSKLTERSKQPKR